VLRALLCGEFLDTRSKLLPVKASSKRRTDFSSSASGILLATVLEILGENSIFIAEFMSELSGIA
jgi:hypothetical protein